MTRAGFVTLLAIAFLLAGCGGPGGRSSQSTVPRPAATGGLTELRSLDQLRAAFNGAAGEAKLVVLMSPT